MRPWWLGLLLAGTLSAAQAAPCAALQLEALGRHLRLANFHPLHWQADGTADEGVLVAADCRPDPELPALTWVAAVHTSQDADGHWLALARLDASGRVLASLHAPAGEDAALHYEPDSLRLDTARYLLAPGVRAVGLDITSGYTPNCGDGGFGAVRTLYVVDGASLRPVLANLFMTSWRTIQAAASRCNPNGPEQDITEHFALSISLGNEHHAGFQDLVIRASSRRDDQHPSGRKPFSHTLRYDGRRYPTEAFTRAYEAWRRPAGRRPGLTG